MTVAELIEKLQEVPQDLPVQVLEYMGYGEVEMGDVDEVRVGKFSSGPVVWIEA
ncbi:hypothetical protein [Actinomadura sp. KC216]|uniref:hypothetical protein n=1 Tax=Actinomadura sp. KC216 TaxID=2530370 RepID=UPI0014054503|nr:hypothetical protein [Actinomadura sp. KC216]